MTSLASHHRHLSNFLAQFSSSHDETIWWHVSEKRKADDDEQDDEDFEEEKNNTFLHLAHLRSTRVLNI